jgi:phage shock protein PspC (stress-responsive transcriptional regulator)
MSNDQNQNDAPVPVDDKYWQEKKGKNLTILGVIAGLAVLFFIITIVRMS